MYGYIVDNMYYYNQKPKQQKLKLLVSPNVVKYNITTYKHRQIIINFNYSAAVMW